MASPLAIYKLIILYLLSRAEGEIAMDRISSFLLEKGYVNFRQTLQMFRSDLSDEIIGQAESFLSREGTALRNEQSVRADCVPAEGGMYNVILKVLERNESVMEIRLQVPDRAVAEEICRKWPDKNEKIYNSLIENLF